jgi:hypothetical protein
VNNPPLKQRASKEPKNLVGCYFNSSVSHVNLLTCKTRYRYYSTIFPVVDTINPLSMVGKLTAFERVLLKKQFKLKLSKEFYD